MQLICLKICKECSIYLMYGLARVKNRRDRKTVSVKIESGCQHPSPKTYICCPLCQLPETDKSTVYMPFGSFQFLLSSADICFKISFKYISKCRTVWIHIDPGVLSGLVQPFCKDFQQMTKIVSSGLFKS